MLTIERIKRRLERNKWELYFNVMFMLKLSYPPWVDTIQTSVTKTEKSILHKIGKGLLAESLCVEIGSYYGASSVCIASGLAATSNRSRLFCIDTWMNDAVSDKKGDTMPAFLENVKQFQGVITCVRGFSDKIIREIPDKIDFLFIDGDHSYEGVTKDLALYLPKLKPNAILAMHDYSRQTVKKAINEKVDPITMKKLYCLGNLYVVLLK